jgi:hypothetical protein
MNVAYKNMTLRDKLFFDNSEYKIIVDSDFIEENNELFRQEAIKFIGGVELARFELSVIEECNLSDQFDIHYLQEHSDTESDDDDYDDEDLTPLRIVLDDDPLTDRLLDLISTNNNINKFPVTNKAIQPLIFHLFIHDLIPVMEDSELLEAYIDNQFNEIDFIELGEGEHDGVITVIATLKTSNQTPPDVYNVGKYYIDSKENIVQPLYTDNTILPMSFYSYTPTKMVFYNEQDNIRGSFYVDEEDNDTRMPWEYTYFAISKGVLYYLG